MNNALEYGRKIKIVSEDFYGLEGRLLSYENRVYAVLVGEDIYYVDKDDIVPILRQGEEIIKENFPEIIYE